MFVCVDERDYVYVIYDYVCIYEWLGIKANIWVLVSAKDFLL